MYLIKFRGKRVSDLAKYVQRDRNKVKGWLTWIDAELIRTILSSQSQVLELRSALEIGVHRGKSAILLLLGPTIEKLVAIDLFGMQEENLDNSGSGNLEEFLNNLERFEINLEKLKIIQINSTQIESRSLRDEVGTLDLVHIDGGHTKAVVLNDLILAANLISEHGVLIVDDFLRPDWPEVGEAVFAWLDANRDFEVFCIGHNKVFMCHLNFTTTWQNEIRNNSNLQYFLRKETQIRGKNVPNYFHFVTTEWTLKKRLYEYVRLFYPRLFINLKVLKKLIMRGQ